jgi:hypothetical protein
MQTSKIDIDADLRSVARRHLFTQNKTKHRKSFSLAIIACFVFQHNWTVTSCGFPFFFLFTGRDDAADTGRGWWTHRLRLGAARAGR